MRFACRFFVAVVVAGFPTTLFASELVGYWKFNESSGNAVDSSGNLADLTNNSVTYSTGQYGNAAYFDGSTSYFAGTGPATRAQMKAKGLGSLWW